MSNDQVQALFTQVNDDPDLQARFKAVSDEAGFNALIAELGYEVSYADFAGAADAELSDSELADVAGGFKIPNPIQDHIDAGRHIEREFKKW